MIVKDPKESTLMRLRQRPGLPPEDDETAPSVTDKRYLDLADQMRQILFSLTDREPQVIDTTDSMKALQSTLQTFVREMQRRKTYRVEIERDSRGLTTSLLLKEM